MPQCLRNILEAHGARKAIEFDTAKKYNGSGFSKYGETALDSECSKVAIAPEGTRNNTLNTSAFTIGQLVAGGEIEYNLAYGRLFDAGLACGLDQNEVERTLTSGMPAGMDNPRSSKPLGEPLADIEEALWIRDCPSFKRGHSHKTDFDIADYRPEDGGILDLWFDIYGQTRIFTVGHDKWFYWNDTHWIKDENLAILNEIERLMDAMNKQAREKSESTDDKDEKRHWARYISATNRSKNRVLSVEGMARGRCAVPTKLLDTGNTLNLRNGVLELGTLELRPHSLNDYFTYCLPYDYDTTADCPRFKRFVSEVFVKENTTETDHDLCSIYQEALGYALTIDTKYEAMFWFSGDGGNGKTVAVTVIQKLLGPMCFSISFEEMGKTGNYDLADVAGKRVIFSTESERGGKMAEGHIKRIVSGERINARPIYGSPFEFTSIAKIFWAMNDLPVIRDTSNGIWRRLKLIPFYRTFAEHEKDPDLLNKLGEEMSGILNYALAGLRSLRQRGRFLESNAVKAAVNEYRHENNPIQQWLDERTQPTYTPGHAPSSYPTTAKTLFDDYRNWAEQNGRQTMNNTNFGRELRRLGIPKSDTRIGIAYAVNLI